MMIRVDHRDERELERLGRVAARLLFENYHYYHYYYYYYHYHHYYWAELRPGCSLKIVST